MLTHDTDVRRNANYEVWLEDIPITTPPILKNDPDDVHETFVMEVLYAKTNTLPVERWIGTLYVESLQDLLSISCAYINEINDNTLQINRSTLIVNRCIPSSSICGDRARRDRSCTRARRSALVVERPARLATTFASDVVAGL